VRTTGEQVMLHVPFLRQQPERCGSAALAMVLRYHGLAVAPSAIAAEVHLPALAARRRLARRCGAGRRGLAAKSGPRARQPEPVASRGHSPFSSSVAPGMTAKGISQ